MKYLEKMEYPVRQKLLYPRVQNGTNAYRLRFAAVVK